jgi:hypothetical protein
MIVRSALYGYLESFVLWIGRYIDQLLLEYKQYSSKLVLQGSLQKEMLELLLEYGVDTLAETLVEGLSQVRRCNNEGRALMSLDLQVLINGVQQVALPRLRSNLQIVETYIKVHSSTSNPLLHIMMMCLD